MTTDIPDLIAGALGVSRGTAYDMMREALAEQQEPLTDERKDAARWRFLVDNSFDKKGVKQFHVWEHSWEPHSQTGEPTEWKQRVRGPALDRFIDRAIEAKLKEKNT